MHFTAAEEQEKARVCLHSGIALHLVQVHHLYQNDVHALKWGR